MWHLSTVLAFFFLPTPGFQIENLKFSHKQEVNSMKLKFTLSQGELENEKNNFQGQTEGENNFFLLHFFIVPMRLNTSIGELWPLCVSVPDRS